MSYKYIEDSRSRQPDALVALDNSSTSLLTANSIFVGSTDDVFAYSAVTVSVYTDQRGTLEIRQSSDGTNWDHVKTFPCNQNQSETHSVSITSRYCNIRYTNGTVDQGLFRLQTIYHMYKQIETSKISSRAVVDEDADSQLVRVVNDDSYDLVSGRYLSRKQVKVFGYAPKIRASLSEMIRDESFGQADQIFETTASTIRVKSGGNVNDLDLTGTGARKVLVWGLNENFLPAEETLNLAGASASTASTTTFIRVFGAKITEVGTYGGKATGNINIETSTGTALTRILAGFSASKKASYCVPAGKTCYIKSVNSTVPADKLGWVDLICREGADVATAPFKPASSLLKFQVQGTSSEKLNLEYCFALPEKTDIWISMISEFGDIENAMCELTLLEVNNTQ